MSDPSVEIEINTLGELYGIDIRRWESAVESLGVHGPGPDIDEIVYCEAFDEEGRGLGTLVLAPDGLILRVEVVPERRRQGIATGMYRRLREAGYRPRHDWENMLGDGEAWAFGLWQYPG